MVYQMADRDVDPTIQATLKGLDLMYEALTKVPPPNKLDTELDTEAFLEMADALLGTIYAALDHTVEPDTHLWLRTEVAEVLEHLPIYLDLAKCGRLQL